MECLVSRKQTATHNSAVDYKEPLVNQTMSHYAFFPSSFIASDIQKLMNILIASGKLQMGVRDWES